MNSGHGIWGRQRRRSSRRKRFKQRRVKRMKLLSKVTTRAKMNLRATQPVLARGPLLKQEEREHSQRVVWGGGQYRSESVDRSPHRPSRIRQAREAEETEREAGESEDTTRKLCLQTKTFFPGQVSAGNRKEEEHWIGVRSERGLQREQPPCRGWNGHVGRSVSDPWNG